MGEVALVVGLSAAIMWSGVLIITDFRTQRLPNILTIPAAVLAVGWFYLDSNFWALCGAFAWWALCVVPGKVSHRLKIGGGDAKLAVSLGAIVTGFGGLLGWYIAVGCASVTTLVLAIHPQWREDREIPHGPGMLLGAWMSILLTS